MSAPVPNGVPISLDTLIATRARWVSEVRAQRPAWWRPLARIAWRVELEYLARMDVSEVAARMRGVLDAGSRSRGSLTACRRP